MQSEKSVRPFVSVLIDTYNHEQFIEQAITSVVRQDFPSSDYEILVVDDGSTDRTPELVKKCGPRVAYLPKKNGGQASAFNHGIAQCRGEIVAFLDGDDWWAPQKLSAVIDAFGSHPAVGLIGHSITEVLADGRERSELVREFPHFRVDSVARARLFRLRKSFLGTSRMAFRGELLRRIGPVPESLVIEADEYLFTMGAVFSEVLLLREPLTYYRHHRGNLFQIDDGDPSALRRKHIVLVDLAGHLRRRLAEDNISSQISNAVIESIEAEADLIGLNFRKVTRLERLRAEFRGYQIMHANASLLRRFLKFASLLPILFLSTNRSESYRKWLTSNSLYGGIRRRLFPHTRPTHVDRTGDWSSR